MSEQIGDITKTVTLDEDPIMHVYSGEVEFHHNEQIFVSQKYFLNHDLLTGDIFVNWIESVASNSGRMSENDMAQTEEKIIQSFRNRKRARKK